MNARCRAAHERLLSQLPVRTHTALTREERAERHPELAGNAARRIQIGNRIYRTFTEARRGECIAPTTLNQWLANGRAKRL